MFVICQVGTMSVSCNSSRFWSSPYKIYKEKTPHEPKKWKWWWGELESASTHNNNATISNNRNRRREKRTDIESWNKIIKYLDKEISTVWQNVVVFQSRDKINNIMNDMSSSVHGQTKRLANIATKHQCKWYIYIYIYIHIYNIVVKHYYMVRVAAIWKV